MQYLLVICLQLLIACICSFTPSLAYEFKLWKGAKRWTSSTALNAELRILIHGTKNAYTTLRSGDVISYKLDKPIDDKPKRLGVLSEDGNILPLCNIVEGGSEFVVDPKEAPIKAERLKDRGQLLRIISSDRRGSEYVIEEYLDSDLYIPILSEVQEKAQNSGPADHSDSLTTTIETQILLLQTLLRDLKSKGSTEAVHSDNAPKAVGPYSQAVKANNLLFVSGCIGLDPQNNKLVEEDVEEQTRQALSNLGAILAAGGSDWKAVTKTTIYLADMKDYAVVNKLYANAFKEAGCVRYPARTTVQVAALPLGALVEIDAIATC